MFSIKSDFLHRRVKNGMPQSGRSHEEILASMGFSASGGPRVAERKGGAQIFKQAFARTRDMDASSLRRAGTILFVGVAQFAFCFALAEIYYPGYDVSVQPISDLGATCKSGVCKFVQPSSDIFNASIVLLGIMLFLTAYYLWKGSGSRALPSFDVLSGIGAVGVGIFNESYGGAHYFFSVLTFLSI